MEQVIPYILAHGLEIVGATVLSLNALIAIALIIPGDSPDKELKAMLDFILRFSRK